MERVACHSKNFKTFVIIVCSTLLVIKQVLSYGRVTIWITIGKQKEFVYTLKLFKYINDLSNAINSTPRLFADDTCLVLRQSSLSALEKACSDELVQLKDWCDTSKIQINPNKSCILHLPPKQNTRPLTFKILYDNSFIVNSICCKYLGILIDNKLNFKQYICTTG